MTALRLITGILACGFFAVGDRDWNILGGSLWVLSAFLDRADGELARITEQTSLKGHKFDMISDMSVTSLFFLGVGVGLRGESILGIELGDWPILLGVLGTMGVLGAEIFAEFIDRVKTKTGGKAFEGVLGFDFDDILYLFAPVVWLDLHLYFVLGASIGAPAFALLTWWKWRKMGTL